MSEKLKFIIAAVVFITVFVLSCYLLAGSEGDSGAVGLYKWDKGESRYEYNFTSDSVMNLEGTVIKTKTNIESVLNVKIFDVKEDVIEIGLFASPVFVTNNGVADDFLEYVYHFPVLIKVSPDGEFLDIQYPENTSEKQRKALIGFYSPLEMVIKKQSSYTVSQKDSVGVYEALYKKSGGRISKEKSKYTSLSKVGDNYIKAVANLKASDYTFAPSMEHSWLDYLNGTETIEYNDNSGETIVSANLKCQLAYIDSAEMGADSFFYGVDFNSALSKFKDGVKVYKEPSRVIPKEKKAEPAKETALMKHFHNLGETKNRKVSLKMRSFLLQNPDVIKDIPRMILNAQINDNQAKEIINILGIIGVPEAQYALADITSDSGQSDNNRLRAVISFSSLKQPMIEEVKTLLLSRVKDIQVSSESIGLYTASVLSIGAVSRNLSEEYSLEAKELSDDLKAMLGASSTLQKKYILKSLGNTYDEDYSEVIGQYVDSSDEVVRQAAVESLRYMEDEYSEKLLSDRLLEEGSGSVRASIVNSLGDRKLASETIDKIMTVAPVETDTDTRRGLIGIIDKNIEDNPDMIKVLEQMAENETSEVNLRKIIRAASKVSQ